MPTISIEYRQYSPRYDYWGRVKVYAGCFLIKGYLQLRKKLGFGTGEYSFHNMRDITDAKPFRFTLCPWEVSCVARLSASQFVLGANLLRRLCFCPMAMGSPPAFDLDDRLGGGRGDIRAALRQETGAVN